LTVQAAFAATLVDEWVRSGVTQAVIAPGSRSTPIVLALAEDGRVALQVVLDERSAGFRALGIGMATGRPAVVVTTSGTAAAELHPAIIEAHQARVPLIAVTTDRPPELHAVGAPQTIDQRNLFVDAVRWSVDPGVADEASSGAWRSLASRSVAEAVGHPSGPGPVHVNLPFRDPLLGEVEGVPSGRAGRGAWHKLAASATPPPDDLVAMLAGFGRRGLIVAGGGAGHPTAVHAMAETLGWPVLADPRSGCRTSGADTVASADALLRVQGFADTVRPDIVVRLGAPWASRVVNTWLDGLDGEDVLVDPYGMWMDPGRRAHRVARCDPTWLCGAVAATDHVHRSPDEWLADWQAAERAAQDAIDAVLANHDEPTEPGVARGLLRALPEESTLVVSSSMPIRDVEWYGLPRDGVRVLANRGANGIDGVVSTAVGVASTRPGWCGALVGDLAFLHDVGGLLWAAQGGDQLTVVVVDNDGGGIFSFLPQATEVAEARFERFFGTAHGVDLPALAAGYGIETTSIAKLDELPDAISAGGVRVVHVRTDRSKNVAVHDEIHAAVSAAVRV
jgi:2-succinyl-5-enolpyruvyl-6-hydroxy-3-cyclohexene-1-carboxylate synthase